MRRILKVFKGGRLLNIYLFLDRDNKKGTFHIHLKQLKAMEVGRTQNKPLDPLVLHCQVIIPS
jgi:hypothetical protein